MAAPSGAPVAGPGAAAYRPRHAGHDRDGRVCRTGRRELLATGETARKRPAQAAAEASQALTDREAQVAQLARDGLSNPEIGARLFISSRTVQYHLGKVFTKLGISSRGQLTRVLPGEPDTQARLA
jgi:DNA-binding CsgD family transcriptional regulator